MSKPITIAIDAMGGDSGPVSVVEGAHFYSQKSDYDVQFLFFGDLDKVSEQLDKFPSLSQKSEIIHTDQVVSSEEKPSTALRSGKKSSMRLAINSVKEGRADAIVSAGNTGALMAMAKIVLRMVPGIQRPAIASAFPAVNGQTVLLDLGANIHCDGENLAQFAILGSVYARLMFGVEKPTVGVLNVGSEDMKGHDQVREAHAILSAAKIPGEYIGFVEGDDITMGDVDVVVTDGFTGNIALKTAEGVGRLTKKFLTDSFKSSPLSWLGALLSFGALRKMKHKTDPRNYNGGIFMGLGGICVKSHGGMDAYGFANALDVSVKMAQNRFNEKVAVEIEHLATQEAIICGKME